MALARVRPIAIGAASAGWPTTSQYGCVNVLDYGAVGDGNADDTLAVQAAVNTCRSVYFPGGDYRVDPITIPTGAAGANYFGDGHYNSATAGLARTILRAYTADQTAVFLLAAGANNVTFSDMLICGSVEAGGNAICGIDGSLNPGLKMYNCDVTYCKEYGVKTGSVANIHRVFFENNLAVGLRLAGDSMLSDSWLGGGVTHPGTVPLWLCLGGNVVSNVNVYGGTECCIKIEAIAPASGPVRNISIVNGYLGEVMSPASMPVIKIQGHATYPAEWIRISNTAIFNSQAALNKINGGILIDHGRHIQLSNVWHYGNADSATATCYTDYFVTATDTEFLVLDNCLSRGVNMTPVVIGAGCNHIGITGSSFIDWNTKAAPPAVPADNACIIQTAATCQLRAVGNFFATELDHCVDNSQYPIHVPHGDYLTWGPNQVECFGSNLPVVDAGEVTGAWQEFTPTAGAGIGAAGMLFQGLHNGSAGGVGVTFAGAAINTLTVEDGIVTGHT